MAPAASRFWKLALLAGILVYEGFAHFALGRPLVREHEAWVVLLAGVPHAAGYLFLLWLFGRTLRNGREALVTVFARRVHGSLPPCMKTYTRRLTVVWCVFFALQLASSALLLAFASVETWSLFVNVLNLPCVIAMFVGDYLYRIARYRVYPQASIAQAIGAFVRHKPFS